MRILKRLYYRFNAWRFGRLYGCGRCHHAFGLHLKRGACSKCCCPEYSIERVPE